MCIRDSIKTIEAPEQKDIEIVSNIAPPPWVEKVSINNLKIVNKTDNKYIAIGTAKTFIVVGKKKYRIAADAVVSGQLDLALGKITAKILLNKGFRDKLPEDTNYLLEDHGATNFNFFLSSDIILRKGSAEEQKIFENNEVSNQTNG